MPWDPLKLAENDAFKNYHKFHQLQNYSYALLWAALCDISPFDFDGLLL